MKKLIQNLQFIFRPMYWIMNYKYSLSWDIELNNLMKNHKFKVGYRDYTAYLGDQEIWIENHPYASFVKSEEACQIYCRRPSRLTILKAKKKLLKDLTI